MKKILFILLMIAGVAHGQITIPGYTGASGGYLFRDRLAVSNGLNIPAGSTPALSTSQWVRAGALYLDTTGGNAGFHFYMNGTWIRLADTSFASRTLQQVLTAGSALTVGVNNITGASSGLYFTNKSFYVNAVDSVFLSNQSCPDCFVRITATGEVDISAANQISLDATDILLPSIQGLHNAGDSMLVWNPTSKIVGYRPIPTGGGGSTLTNIGTGISIGVDATNNTKKVDGINSISADSTTTANTVTFKLVNDQTSPGNNYAYSTSITGVKQWNKFYPMILTGPTDGQSLVLDISGSDTSIINATVNATPAGNNRNVQINVGGVFGTPASDSASFTANGLDIKGKYLVNGGQVLYRPDQTSFVNTIYYGNGGGSLSSSTGLDGDYNTYVGIGTGNSNSTGSQNTGVGARTLTNLTTATKNTAVGNDAMYNITNTSTQNTAIGVSSMQSATTGSSSSTGIGFESLYTNNANFNTGVGTQTLRSLSSGTYNTGIGMQAGYHNATGSQNTYIGGSSGLGVASNSNSRNSAFGYYSLNGITTGVGNIAIGDSAGYNSTTSIRNIIIGTAATASSATAKYEMNIGGLLFGTGMTATGTSTAGSLGVGVGAGSISARLHLPAGTSSASTASLKITEGVKTTTAEDGAIEKDDAFYVTKTNAVRMGVGGSLTTLYSTVGNVGAGEDDLQTYSIPAGTLSQDGDYIEFTMSFSVAVNSTLKVYFGATQLFSFAALATDAVYRVTGQVVRTGAATQRASFIMNGGAVQTVVGYQTPTETLSGAVTLKATGEGTSNNDITQTLTMVKFFPAN